MSQLPLGFREELVKAEISGKNAAIHAYDGMMWKVRSGYLTLMFGGWALILGGLLSKEPKTGGISDVLSNKATPHVLRLTIVGMLAVSLGLAVAGFMIDWNYKRRKFRVIAKLNELYQALWSAGAHGDGIGPLLQVAGDTNDTCYKDAGGGYESAFATLFWIYPFPLAVLILGLLLGGARQLTGL